MIWKPHATVAAVIHRNGQFLLVDEIKHGARVINQPAGHLEDGESLIQAVIREVREETAWLFEPTALLGIYRSRDNTTGETYMRTAVIGNVSDHHPTQPLDEGIQHACWLSVAQLKNHTVRSPLVVRCIEDYLAGYHYPLALLRDHPTSTQTARDHYPTR